MSTFEVIVTSVFGGIFVVMLVWAACINWTVHLSMTKDNAKNGLVWGSFKDFEREFLKIDWKRHPMFLESLFNRDTDSELHANIIRINGIGIRMRTPIDYIRVRRFIERELKSGGYGWLHLGF